MVKKSKNVNITTPNVVVNTGRNPSTAIPVPNSVRTARNRRRRARRSNRNAAANAGQSNLDVVTSGMELLELQGMNSGRMTGDCSSDLSFIRSINAKCDMDSNTEGWYYKYLDPAGSVETGRAIGEFSKIPDGLLTFSVDAEIRTIDTLPVPLLESESPGGLPLDGATWSLTIFSYPMFRTAFIAVANRFDKELSTGVASELAFTLNNLTDYRVTIDANDWAPFAELIEDGWFYWIKPLPPTYNLADPVTGDQRTLTSWRMSYKSITLEHNAPTLIDQGFWNGAHYALDPGTVQQSVQETEMIPSSVHGRSGPGNATTASSFRALVRIPNLPQLSSINGPATLIPGSMNLEFQITGDNSVTGLPITWIVPSNTAMYNPFESVFAEPGDTVSVVTSFTGIVDNAIITFSSSNLLAFPFTLVFNVANPPGPFLPQGTEAQASIFVDNSVDVFGNRTSNQIEFPAYTTSQIAANNPKQEQFLMKETNGAYVVHKKMRKPVFELTPASSFGPVQFTTPDYNISRNSNDGSGILDTFDANFSTAVIAVRGIAHANVPVLKLYQGWEGVTNVNTPFGQFGHTGLPRSDCVLQLVDNLTVRTTGVYPANDNFLGLIAKFAAGALKTLFSSQATSSMLGNLATGAINKGLGLAANKVGQLMERPMARPLRRRI
jgi:hypothetical protein